MEIIRDWGLPVEGCVRGRLRVRDLPRLCQRGLVVERLHPATDEEEDQLDTVDTHRADLPPVLPDRSGRWNWTGWN